jgi:hypothetical protein
LAETLAPLLLGIDIDLIFFLFCFLVDSKEQGLGFRSISKYFTQQSWQNTIYMHAHYVPQVNQFKFLLVPKMWEREIDLLH